MEFPTTVLNSFPSKPFVHISRLNDCVDRFIPIPEPVPHVHCINTEKHRTSDQKCVHLSPSSHSCFSPFPCLHIPRPFCQSDLSRCINDRTDYLVFIACPRNRSRRVLRKTILHWYYILIDYLSINRVVLSREFNRFDAGAISNEFSAADTTQPIAAQPVYVF
jgi:hypothetical protein